MKRILTRSLAAAVAFAGVSVSSPEDAHAWLKFTNSTPWTVWVSHAYASYDSGVCGFWDACQGSSGVDTYRVQGWWGMAPGGSATVDSHRYGTAWRQYYAVADNGAEWRDGGYTFWLDFNNHFSFCGSFQWPYFTPKAFRVLRTTRKCLGTKNYTVNLVP